MQSIYELVTFESQNEHDLEHDLAHKKPFSIPKIYDANGDLSKRWYVYFSYLNPKTGKLERMKNIYGKTNRYKTKEARYSVLSIYKKRLLKLLKDGYNPFDDNTEHHKLRTAKQTNVEIKENFTNKTHSNNNNNNNNNNKSVVENRSNTDIISLREAIDLAIALKTNIVSKRTIVDYQSRCNILIKYLKGNSIVVDNVRILKKKTIIDFLNSIQVKTSARNRNNYRTCLSSVFQTMEDNELIEKNFIKNINHLKSNPQRNKTYSVQQQEEIFQHLETEDPILLLYIKFISYNLLRPIEVCRLKIKNIDFLNRTLQFQAKNKLLKTKIIPEILFKSIPDLSMKEGDLYLFTPYEIGGVWSTELTNRRDYFSKRFKTVVKDHFGLDKNYGLYSFRHTFITKMYRAMVKESSPFAAKSNLMQITGHTTMTALEKYLRDIDAELPEDYSKLL
ncbi:tyrosine-type recombinase/integrase [Psychroserpens damuponensis]|uniref:tyrosine-type recombinase/integrase n=1 Tax=Psychroserpens damuponensis TaxID=943936 RepID=UPI00058ED276|nr:tyrosine-type recombinase/integrase [Psychroserpens damuponensis]